MLVSYTVTPKNKSLNRYNYNPIPNSVPKNTDVNVVQNDKFWNKCFYYPFFTSQKDEMSDEEFEAKKDILYNKFLKSPNIFLGGNVSNATTAIRYVRKDNLAVANKFAEDLRYAFHQYAAIMRNVNKDNEQFALNVLFDDKIDQRDYDFPHILQCINKDNSEFAEQLCRDRKVYSETIAETLIYTNKKTIKLAKALYNESYNYTSMLPQILNIASDNDSISTFSTIAAWAIKNNLPYPEFALAALPENISKSDINFINDIYFDSEIYKHQKIGTIDLLDKSNIHILRTALNNKGLSKCIAYNLFTEITPYNEKVMEKIVSIATQENINSYIKILDRINQENHSFILKLVSDKNIPIKSKLELSELSLKKSVTNSSKILEKLYDKGYSPEEIKRLSYIDNIKPEAAEFYADTDIKKNLKTLDRQEKLFFKYPEKYINGQIINFYDVEDLSDTIFRNDTPLLIILADLLDKESLDVLFRKRHLTVIKFKDEINNLSYEQLKTLKDALNCTNRFGKPLLPNQKIELLNLYITYTSIDADTNKIIKMIKTGKVDIGELNKNLIISILSKFNISSKAIKNAPAEKLLGWDFENFHKLIREYSQLWADKDRTKDIVKAACLGDFKKYITDTSNIYGKANRQTENQFKELGLNYNKWLNPSLSNEVNYKFKNYNKQNLDGTATLIEKDIRALCATPARDFIFKQLTPWMKDGKFNIPSNDKENYASLIHTLESILAQLSGVWKRAEFNINSKSNDLILMAHDTLIIYNHLKLLLKDLKNEAESKPHSYKPLDIKVKMWDRIPQKDIFQGNYSNCCIGMDDSHSYAMFDYILNTAFNMIEIIDKNTGKTIGNALCYFVKDEESEESKVALVLDNIEIKTNAIKDEISKLKVREAISEYAKNIAKDVTGKEDTPVYLGISYNDVNVDDLTLEHKPLSLIGKCDKNCMVIYLDVFSGRISPYKASKTVKVYNLEKKN